MPKKNPTPHSGVTLDTSSHVLPDMQDGLANAVANPLNRKPKMD
ncbi:uncharacterized protein METZ01_LOCUS103018 [marine metagenome]|uniref:Uncharacterized protein n=1 Tax=marine metagenome TaxID=408172 RepID=A0A381WCH2_9ZZZZ